MNKPNIKSFTVPESKENFIPLEIMPYYTVPSLEETVKNLLCTIDSLRKDLVNCRDRLSRESSYRDSTIHDMGQ